ncbi:MAG: hypothetical protein HRT36_06040 [Alphaproteobacteria bacterium]|nr:hypothetical protein [Alphaproteobacteria bacterium]
MQPSVVAKTMSLLLLSGVHSVMHVALHLDPGAVVQRHQFCGLIDPACLWLQEPYQYRRTPWTGPHVEVCLSWLQQLHNDASPVWEALVR